MSGLYALFYGFERCAACEGRGLIHKGVARVRLSDSFYDCPKCKGSGLIAKPKDQEAA